MTNPLKQYLDSRPELTQEDFAELLTVARGWPVTQSDISRWSTGSRFPSTGTRMAITRATRGAVTEDQWQSWRQWRSQEAHTAA